MNRARNIRRTIVILVIVVVVAAGAVLVLNLDRIVKTGVETYGPKMTGVTVTVDAVHIGLLTASANIKNLVVGNPQGYQSPQAISIGAISAGIDPTTVFSQKTRIRFIKIESPQITFDGGLGGNNLATILNNVNGSEASGGPAVTNAVGNPKPAKKYEVDDLLITGAKVNGSIVLFAGQGNLNSQSPRPRNPSDRSGPGNRWHHHDRFDAPDPSSHHHFHHQNRRHRSGQCRQRRRKSRQTRHQQRQKSLRQSPRKIDKAGART